MKKFKISNQVNAQICEVAKHLPALVNLDKNGKVIFHTVIKSVSWDKLSDTDKKRIPKPDKDIKYKVPFRNASRVDHYLEMIRAYRDGGEDGVAKYVEKVNSVTEASKAAAATVNEKEETSNAESFDESFDL